MQDQTTPQSTTRMSRRALIASGIGAVAALGLSGRTALAQGAPDEAAIQAALDVVMQGRTSLVIAHRLSTVVAADVIFVVEAGRVVESGTHEALLAKGGAYAHLYRTQFRSSEAPAAATAAF